MPDPARPLPAFVLAPSGRPQVLDTGHDTDLLPLYLLRYEAVNTRRSYANDLSRFFGASSVTLQMARQITFVEVNRHLEALAAGGARPATIQRRAAALSGFFSWLVALGVLEHNPADPRLIRRTKQVRRRDRVVTVLTREDARRLLDAFDPENESYVRDRTLLLVLLHCVLRRSEARDMDFEHIRPSGRFWILDLPSAKGGADQYVKIPDRVAEALHHHRDHYGYSSGPVWRSLSNNSRNRRLSTTSIYNIVHEASLRAGIAANVGAHTLRHTGCTLAIEAGASIQQVQSHARHKNLETTMIYVHQRDRLKDSAADYIDI
jgi:site-specific recombinase XerD